MTDKNQYLKEVLPSTGLLFQEEFQSFVLSKPKLIPLKSVTLQKLENMQQEAEKKAKEQMGKSDSVSQWRFFYFVRNIVMKLFLTMKHVVCFFK